MKTPKQRGAKAPARERARVNLSLDAEASRRLFVTAVMSGRSAGDLVTELIETHLRSWSMPANLASRASKSDRHDGANSSTETAPVLHQNSAA